MNIEFTDKVKMQSELGVNNFIRNEIEAISYSNNYNNDKVAPSKDKRLKHNKCK